MNNVTAHMIYGVLQHEPDKLSPWRVRGTPLGGGAAPSQLPDTEDVNAAMATAGQMAAFFPATQAEPDTNADTDAVVSAPLPTSAVQAKAADGPNQQNSDSRQDSKAQQNKKNGTATAAASAAAGSEEEDQAAAATVAQRYRADDVPQVKSMQTKEGSDAKKPAPAAATAALAGADVPQQVSDGAAARHTAQGREEAGGMQQEEEVQAPKAAGRGKGKGRASVSTKASVDDDEEEEIGKVKAKRGRGSAGAGARGGSRGRAMKAPGQGAAAKDPLPTSAADSDVADMDVDTVKPKVIGMSRTQEIHLPVPSNILLFCLVNKPCQTKVCLELRAQRCASLKALDAHLFFCSLPRTSQVKNPCGPQQTLIWQYVDNLPAAAGRGGEEQKAKVSKQGGQPGSGGQQGEQAPEGQSRCPGSGGSTAARSRGAGCRRG